MDRIKANCPRMVTPRLHPPHCCYVPNSPVLQTESTGIVDSDDALSSGRMEPGVAEGYSSNPMLLQTQPVEKLTAPVPMHTHTRSYDVVYMHSPAYVSAAPYLYCISRVRA